MPIGNNNTWGPGGAMYNRGPGRTYIRQMSQYGNHFFTPPTPEEIRKEAMLQLAVLAVVVAAPVVLPLIAGGGAAAGAGAAVATTTAVEGGTVAAGAVAVGGGAASASGMAGLHALLGLGAAQAAGLGANALNNFFHKSAPASNSQQVEFDSGQEQQQTPQVLQNRFDTSLQSQGPSQNTTQQNRHPAMSVLENLAEKISKDGALQRLLKKVDPCCATGKIGGAELPPSVKEVVEKALREGEWRNPWEESNNPYNEEKKSPSQQKQPHNCKNGNPDMIFGSNGHFLGYGEGCDGKVTIHYFREVTDRDQLGNLYTYLDVRNPEIIPIDESANDLLRLAGIAKLESSCQNDIEKWAIANAVMNFIKGYNTFPGEAINLSDVVNHRVDSYQYYASNRPLKHDSYDNRDRMAIKGAVNAILTRYQRGNDYSGGATHWDGPDFIISGVKHPKPKDQGVVIFNDHWKQMETFYRTNRWGIARIAGQTIATMLSEIIPATGYNAGRVLYRSTTQAGGSVFWGPNNGDDFDQNDGYNWYFYYRSK